MERVSQGARSHARWWQTETSVCVPASSQAGTRAGGSALHTRVQRARAERAAESTALGCRHSRCRAAEAPSPASPPARAEGRSRLWIRAGTGARWPHGTPSWARPWRGRQRLLKLTIGEASEVHGSSTARGGWASPWGLPAHPNEGADPAQQSAEWVLLPSPTAEGAWPSSMPANASCDKPCKKGPEGPPPPASDV